MDGRREDRRRDAAHARLRNREDRQPEHGWDAQRIRISGTRLERRTRRITRSASPLHEARRRTV